MVKIKGKRKEQEKEKDEEEKEEKTKFDEKRTRRKNKKKKNKKNKKKKSGRKKRREISSQKSTHLVNPSLILYVLLKLGRFQLALIRGAGKSAETILNVGDQMGIRGDRQSRIQV